MVNKLMDVPKLNNHLFFGDAWVGEITRIEPSFRNKKRLLITILTPSGTTNISFLENNLRGWHVMETAINYTKKSAGSKSF